MDSVQVTVGICVKNCEKTIGRTLDSIIQQDYSSNFMEVIVVDDGCEDNTIPIVREKLSRATMSFKILKTGGNGLGAARQLVVNHAKGEYIVWVDGDIVIPSDHIRKQVKFMNAHPHVGKARANWGFIKVEGLLASCQQLAYTYQAKSGVQPAIAGIGGSICRVAAIKDAGGFDIHIKGAGEDIDLAIRLIARGWNISISDALFYHSPKASWEEIWNQNVWYGYGEHYISHKYKKSVALTLLPPVVLAIGVKKAIIAFKFIRDLRSLFLPLFFLLGSFAWWIGFIKAHFEKYES